MDTEGNVLDVNRAFTNNFGYNNNDINGRNFSILFTEEDKKRQKPQLELETVNLKGQAQDENYVIDKSGHAIWCTGESLLVAGTEGEKYIVKDIVNLQAKKQLQLFLSETEEVLERIFDSSKDIAMMILDGSMKVQKVNAAFLSLFEISNTPVAHSRLSDIDNPFWNDEEIRKELTKTIITNQPSKQKEFLLLTKQGEKKTIKIDSKIIDRQGHTGRKIFIIVEDVSAETAHWI